MFSQSVLFENEIIDLGYVGACTKCHRFKEVVEMYVHDSSGDHDVLVLCHRCSLSEAK